MSTFRGYHREWSENAERQRVPAEVVIEIARQHGITPARFNVLENMEQIKDPYGKSYFLIPRGTSGDDAREAVLMTYVVNAGTDYAKRGNRPADFPEPPYSATEVQRIVDRQRANSWSYRRDVRFVDRNAARLVTTPNGILMGLGGNWIQAQFSQQGGTTWGDIFMFNIAGHPDPVQQLRRIIGSGRAWCTGNDGEPLEGYLDLDRLLHHEERHCAQWAAKGYAGMIRAYSWELLRERVFGKTNRLEADAGLSDGGYRA